MSPQRIQRKRTRGWRMPEGVVSVCRPGRWGNVFREGTTGWIPLDDSGVWSKEPHPPLTREQAVQCFRFMAEHTAREFPGHYEPLRGKDLACFCPLDQPCHADVLLEIANRGDVLTAALADPEGQHLVQDILDRKAAKTAPPGRKGG